MDKESKKIVLCGKCSGQGSIECKELEDYHKGEYRYWDEECSACKGSGRLVEKTTITYTPYKRKSS